MKTEVAKESSRLIALLSGVLIAYAITCIIFLGYSMLITYTSMSGENIQLVAAAATLISVIVAGFDSARGADTKGWFWGIMAGFVYAIIFLIIMTVVTKGFALDSRTIILIVLALAGGGLGGVVGINFKN
jgi:putative membrane protein (TIGR04086 family)